MRWIEEPFCRGDRPAVVKAVTISLILIGCLLLIATGTILLLGSAAILILTFPSGLILGTLIVAAVGSGYFLLAWGYHEGHRWAWVGAILGTMPLLGLAWISWGDGDVVWAAGAWTLFGLTLLIQITVWLPSTRRLFWGRQRIDLP